MLPPDRKGVADIRPSVYCGDTNKVEQAVKRALLSRADHMFPISFSRTRKASSPCLKLELRLKQKKKGGGAIYSKKSGVRNRVFTDVCRETPFFVCIFSSFSFCFSGRPCLL